MGTLILTGALRVVVVHLCRVVRINVIGERACVGHVYLCLS